MKFMGKGESWSGEMLGEGIRSRVRFKIKWHLGLVGLAEVSISSSASGSVRSMIPKRNELTMALWPA